MLQPTVGETFGLAGLTPMGIFEHFANAFPLVSDESKRWTKEGPFLLDLAGSRGGRILDLACGSGFHARHLAGQGFAVTGVELSASTIRRGRLLPDGDRVCWIEGDITKQIPGSFDLVLLIGNTLSLFQHESDVRKIFGSVSNLVEGGVFVIHVIDFDYLREHPVRIEREGNVDGKRVIFEKRIEPQPHGAIIRITVTTDDDVSPDTETERLFEHGAPRLTELASEFGFKLRSEAGGLDGTPRKPGETKDVVLVFELEGA